MKLQKKKHKCSASRLNIIINAFPTIHKTFSPSGLVSKRSTHYRITTPTTLGTVSVRYATVMTICPPVRFRYEEHTNQSIVTALIITRSACEHARTFRNYRFAWGMRSAVWYTMRSKPNTYTLKHTTHTRPSGIASSETVAHEVSGEHN